MNAPSENIKLGPTDSIKAVVIGENDSSNNKIVFVLATSNEFAIYEIDHPDINSRIRVLVDGHTNESEEKIRSRFNKVKQRYIEAKGLLAKSPNPGMMKHRIAHTLSTCLHTDEVDGNKEFQELINTIEKEHESLVINRAMYLLPAFISSACAFLIVVGLLWADLYKTHAWTIFTSVLAASLGGGLSILTNAKSANFEEFRAKGHYVLLGLERIFLALMAGAIAFVAVKSGVVLPEFTQTGYWAVMAVLVVSGFSESFIPGILGKISAKDA